MRRFLEAGLALMICGGGPAMAGSDNLERFSAHAETAEVELSYSTLDMLLQKLVFRVGESNRFTTDNRQMRTGTRLQRGNRQPSWLEGNRLAYHLLDENQVEALIAHRRTLERLPGEIGGLARMTRDQQLAYWLNLYTVTVMGGVAARYPITDLRRMRDFWDAKGLTVEGIALSLNDIQDDILIRGWDDPLVIYGLYRGAIGGPNIHRTAYTAANVWRLLRSAAADFVNSIRGVHEDGKVARASVFYRWTGAAFPDGLQSLRQHLYRYGDDQTRAILAATERLEPTYFDWNIADIYNGRLRDDRMLPTHFGLGVLDESTAGLDSYNFTGVPEARVPAHVRNFFRALQVKYSIHGWPEGNVSIKEYNSEGRRPDRGDPD